MKIYNVFYLLFLLFICLFKIPFDGRLESCVLVISYNCVIYNFSLMKTFHTFWTVNIVKKMKLKKKNYIKNFKFTKIVYKFDESFS